jgi:hypothetical protein
VVEGLFAGHTRRIRPAVNLADQFPETGPALFPVVVVIAFGFYLPEGVAEVDGDISRGETEVGLADGGADLLCPGEASFRIPASKGKTRSKSRSKRFQKETVSCTYRSRRAEALSSRRPAFNQPFKEAYER